MIEVRNLVKKYGNHTAVDNLSFTVKDGQVYGFLGPNGAGKSTLMSILFGLYQPDSGIIKKDGKEVKITDPNVATSLHIGMVHQHFKLVEVYSVLDNIILGDEPIKEYNFSAKNKVLNGFLKGFSKTMTFLNKHPQLTWLLTPHSPAGAFATRCSLSLLTLSVYRQDLLLNRTMLSRNFFCVTWIVLAATAIDFQPQTCDAYLSL